MTFHTTSIVALLSLTLCGGASAQLLTKTSSANDDLTGFNKRIAIRNDAMSNLVREAERLGWSIYRNESLTDMAGYVLAGQTTLAQRSSIRDSIVVSANGQWRVRFYAMPSDGQFVPIADVVFENDGSGSIVPYKSLVAFSNSELALIRATELVKDSQKDPCNADFKLIVIPAPSGNGFYAYQLRECFDSEHLPEGQHIRFEVSADGSKIVAQREFARRCNVLPVQNPTDSGLPEVKLTNTMDPQPTELHIYLSMRYGVHIFLASMQSNLYWQINDGVVKSD
jgi:hypothetical protein